MKAIRKNLLKSSIESTLLFVDLLLSRESSMNPNAYRFASKKKQQVDEVKSAMHDA